VAIGHFPALHQGLSCPRIRPNRDRTEPIPQDFKVRFLDEDWTVNQRPVPDVNYGSAILPDC